MHSEVPSGKGSCRPVTIARYPDILATKTLHKFAAILLLVADAGRLLRSGLKFYNVLQEQVPLHKGSEIQALVSEIRSAGARNHPHTR